MKVIDEKSCRICLCANSAFVNVFENFHGRSIEQIVLEVCDVSLSRDITIPQFICELCMSRLLLADSIKKLCRKNEIFLTELAEIALIDPVYECPEEKEVIEPIVEEINEVFSLDEYNEELALESAEKTQTTDAVNHVEWNRLMELNRKAKDLKKKEKTNYFCTYCFAEFNTRSKCIYHEKTKHQTKQNHDVKQVTCDRCGTKFKNKSHVINHLNVVHLRIKRYQCNVCGFAMYSKTQHSIHMKSHSNIKDFKCNSCGKAFGRKEALQVHLRTHTNERPYVCRYCNRSYTAHTDLKRHIYLHTQVQPYLCQICSDGFFLKRKLLEHVNHSHPGVDTTSWLTGKTLHNF